MLYPKEDKENRILLYAVSLIYNGSFYDLFIFCQKCQQIMNIWLYVRVVSENKIKINTETK